MPPASDAPFGMNPGAFVTMAALHSGSTEGAEMCGIVGYVGNEEACGLLLGCLRALEYRGYDSAGIALLENGRITRFPDCVRQSQWALCAEGLYPSGLFFI